jgi:hypothetical protein
MSQTSGCTRLSSLTRTRDVLEAQLSTYHLDGKDIVKAVIAPN